MAKRGWFRFAPALLVLTLPVFSKVVLADDARSAAIAEKGARAQLLVCEGPHLQYINTSGCIDKLSLAVQGLPKGDNTPQFRAFAFELLGNYLPESSSALPLAMHGLTDESPIVRRRAAEFIAKANPNPLSEIAPYLAHNNPEIRRTAVSALTRSRSDAALHALSKLLDDPDRMVSIRAALALNKIDTPDAQALLDHHLGIAAPLIESELGSNDRELRKLAVTAVGEFRIVSAVPILLGMIDSDEGTPARGSLAQLAPRSTPSLVKLLQGGTDAEKCAAANTLGQIKPTTLEIVVALEWAYRKQASQRLKNEILSALKSIDTEDSRMAFVRLTATRSI